MIDHDESIRLTAANFFGRAVPQLLKRRSVQDNLRLCLPVTTDGVSFAFCVTGALGGAWTLRYEGATYDFRERAVGDARATVTVTVSDDTFEALLSGDLDPGTALRSGLVLIDGDGEQLALLAPLFRDRP